MANNQEKLLDQSFPPGQRIKSQKDIEGLFASQNSFFRYPFKVVFKVVDSGNHPLRLLISVPKRIIKKAVERNKVKRLIREAWRRNKSLPETQLGKTSKKIDIALIYTAKDILPYKEIEDKIIQIFQRLIKVNEDC